MFRDLGVVPALVAVPGPKSQECGSSHPISGTGDEPLLENQCYRPATGKPVFGIHIHGPFCPLHTRKCGPRELVGGRSL